MRRILGATLLATAAFLLYFGLRATDSLGERVLEGVTGRYSEQTMRYLIGGGITGVAGVALLIFGGRK